MPLHFPVAPAGQDPAQVRPPVHEVGYGLLVGIGHLDRWVVNARVLQLQGQQYGQVQPAQPPQRLGEARVVERVALEAGMEPYRPGPGSEAVLLAAALQLLRPRPGRWG